MCRIKLRFLNIIFYLMMVRAAEKEVKRDQYCTDPRTMKKHSAYTEWTDAYSCTRHRCQPGGRDLAIFTVGCKRVEAPESAIQCEEVVEDTNIQFPYCCTRLRCLVVVRGEVWTRVIGQPWENLPAAPWSHMYKKKKPPPGSSGILNKNLMELPKPQITEDNMLNTVIDGDVKTRSGQPCTGHHDALRSPLPSPDIVIALTTGDKESEAMKVNDNNNITSQITDTDSKEDLGKFEKEFEDQNDTPVVKANEESQDTEDKSEFNLQNLVDAIGLRMRDIEDVVQKMSQKVEEGKKSVFKEDQEIDVRSKTEEPKTELPMEEVTISYYSDPSNALSRKLIKEPTQYMAPIEPRSHKTLEKKRKRRKKNHSGHKKRKDLKKKNTNKIIKEVDSAILSIEDENNKYL